MSKEAVVLCDTRDNGESHHVSAEIGTRGELVFVGQDLSSGNSIMGYREYEWSVTVELKNIPTLTRALRLQSYFGWLPVSNSKLLRVLRRRFSGRMAREIKPFLDRHDVPYSLWSRIGD